MTTPAVDWSVVSPYLDELLALDGPGRDGRLDAIGAGDAVLAARLRDRWCDTRALGVAARIALVLQVLDAVAAAHAQLVIHRDLKPSNVLVDDSGRVRLLDFGIARLLPGAGSGETALTREGLPALTPPYAPPEQFEAMGTDRALSTAIDVFALGVVLHELLVGVHPSGLHNAGLGQYLKSAQRGPARRASDWVTVEVEGLDAPAVRGTRRGTTPNALAAQLRGDLDAILMKALAPRAADRYASIETFADDLRNHLESRPVRARPAGVAYVIGKQMRRYRWAYAAAVGVFAALAAGVGATLWQARVAQAEAARANAVQQFVLDIFRKNSSSQPDPLHARETPARELLDAGSEELDRRLAGNPAAAAEIATTLAQMYSDMGLSQKAAAMRAKAAGYAEKAYGRQSLELVQALSDWAAELNHVAPQAERRTVLDRALAIVRARPDRPSRERAQVYLEASAFERSLDPARALQYADLALAEAERLDDDTLRYVALEASATTHLNGRDDTLAANLYKRALAVAERCQCKFPAELIRTRVQLGEAQSSVLDIGGAEQSLREALAASVKLNGPHHLDTLQTALRLGGVLNTRGALREAFALLGPLREVVDGPAGPDEFSGPHLLNVLGNKQSQLGQHEDAIATLKRAIALRDRSRANTVFAGTLRQSLGGAYLRAGRAAEAIEMLAQGEKIERGTGGAPGTERWINVADFGARAHLQRGDLDAARRRADELPPGLEDGATPSVTAMRASMTRAQVDLDTGRIDDATRRLAAVRTLFDKRGLAAQLPSYEARRQYLCGRWAMARAPGQSRAHFERSAAMMREMYGANAIADQALVESWRVKAPAAGSDAAVAAKPC